MPFIPNLRPTLTARALGKAAQFEACVAHAYIKNLEERLLERWQERPPLECKGEREPHRRKACYTQ